MILHIDMDAFFASIEQAVNPRLKGKPLIVGSRPGRLYTVVCAASYEAKAYGIGSGMSSKEAFRLCPDLEFVAADQSKYIWTSEQILAMLEEYGFPVEYASIDEFRLDVPKEAHPEALAEEIRSRISQTFRITASVGIAGNCILAKLASKLDKPDGLVVLTEANLEPVLAKTGIEKLCGVGEKTSLILRLAGVNTCLELYQKPASFLGRLLGKNGLNLYASLHSTEHLEPAKKQEKLASIGHSYTLSRASQNPGFIRAWIRLLSEMVARRLRQQNLAAKTIHLWLQGPQRPVFSAQKTFQEPTNDGYEVYQRCLKIMASRGLKRPEIRALGVTGSSLFSQQYPPLFKEQKRRGELIKTLDSINSRYGEYSIYPAAIMLARR